MNRQSEGSLEIGDPVSEMRRFVGTIRRAGYLAELRKLRSRRNLRFWFGRAARRVKRHLSFIRPALRPLAPLRRLLTPFVRTAVRAAVVAWKRTAGLLIRLGHQLLSRLFVRLIANRRSMRRLARLVVKDDGAMRLSRMGERLLSFGCRVIELQIPLASGLARRTIGAVQLTLLSAQMAAGNVGNAITLARITNLAFRPAIKARRQPESFLYLQALFHGRQYGRIVREFSSAEVVDSHYINHMAGVSHLYAGDLGLAKFFLQRALKFHDQYFLDFRMLGRLHLMNDELNDAARYFARSVQLASNTVMAHQNYAGRYDIPNYVAKGWELAAAGRLLIYDNYCQLAEEFFLAGDFARSFRNYQKMLDFQKLGRLRLPPKSLAGRLQSTSPTFDADKPIRLLSYEWVTQFGHIGLLDGYIKMARLGMYPEANYVLLAPRDKVVNREYLAYWERFFTIVRDEELIGELFPYQRAIGDNFMAYPGGGGVAEPWTRAAARAQVEWARQHRGPLLAVSDTDRDVGEDGLRQLGVPEGAWYVGLHVREGGYYEESSGGMSTHRNSHIADYLPAVRSVIDRGGYVIRLGDKSMRPLEPMPGLIDYALSPVKSPQMDIFLCGTSRFVIGTTSGLTTASISFGTQMLLVNCISNDWQLWSGETDFILKRIYDIREKRILPLTEAFSMPTQGYLINTHTMRRRGLRAVANTPDEIDEAVRYKLDLLDRRVSAPRHNVDPLVAYRAAMADNPVMFGAATPVTRFLLRHPGLLAVPEHTANERRLA